MFEEFIISLVAIIICIFCFAVGYSNGKTDTLKKLGYTQEYVQVVK